tara:strand:+ start:216 stop:365 length:150 start_codon:yes stop_codon:yes gene_type:complete
MRDHLSIVETNLIQQYKAVELKHKVREIKKGTAENVCDQSAQTTADFFS